MYCTRRHESYIGHIDLDDIRVICNRAVTSRGAWDGRESRSEDGVVVNVKALDALQPEERRGNQKILNCERVAVVKPGASEPPATCGEVEVLVENGRIVLQYRNVDASTDSSAAKLHDPDMGDWAEPLGHVISAPASQTEQTRLEYDMNDVVWKNMAASCTTK